MATSDCSSALALPASGAGDEAEDDDAGGGDVKEEATTGWWFVDKLGC